MNYPSINIQGNIISSEILDKIRNEDIKFQQAGDFGLDRRTSVRDEIGVSWAAARAHYMAFRLRVDRLKEGDSGASETRNSWILPLLRELGYDAEKAPAFIHPDTQKSYAISHHVPSLGNFPIHIMGVNDDLDKRRETSGPRLSPHALVQEYLNNTEHVYALVSNGRFLRLLRDATRLVRLSYLEFDLEKMMEDELYADFAILFRLLHSTRIPKTADQCSESPIEYYHQESLSSGSRIRKNLSLAVEKSIKTLANGFLKHPANTAMRTRILADMQKPDKLAETATEYYSYQLRLIYRLLFLIVTEERNLVYPDSRDPEIQRQRKIYYQFYSIEKLRKLALRGVFVDGNKHDLWEGLKTTFELFERSQVGAKLGIQALGSGIFSPHALGDLSQQKLSNETLLSVIRNLTLFENDQKQLVRVNYGDLDVEEFGSVYEGLLEFDAAFKEIDGIPLFSFVEGKGRSSSGSHYTPEELVKPLIKHSLDYLIADKLKETDPEKALLSLKVCDVACGSGHILLSAARRIAVELARVRSGEDQPSPTVLRQAMRDAIKNCIYGVDKNPLAVELCKVALWLESHNPGEPLGFLDHHIKCGDAIVGLAHQNELKNGIPNEAFKALPDDDKVVASTFLAKNKKERLIDAGKGQQLQAELNPEALSMVQEAMEQYGDFMRMPERTPEEVEARLNAYNRVINGRGQSWLKAMADTQIAQFFIPKDDAHKEYLMTDADFRAILTGHKGWQNQKVAYASPIAQEKRFFHWFIEFPEVFSEGGFDCVLGNPPFLGGQKLSGSFGDSFLESIKYQFAPIGAVDLVTYFFRRIYSIIKPKGFQSLISTNTIAQGRSREDGLDIIVRQGGSINHAIKSMKWPGIAAVEVALVTITKQQWNRNFILGGKEVKIITPYLDDEETLGNPFILKENESKAFQGSIVLGKGYVLEPSDALALIAKDKRNEEVIFPYLNGEELNNNPDQMPGRWVINFFERSEVEAKEYPDCYNILLNSVKGLRQKDKRKDYRDYWWLHAEKRPGLYRAIKNYDRVLVQGVVTKTHGFSFVDSNIIFSSALSVFLFDTNLIFSILQGNFHEAWAWKYSSTMKSDRSYNIKDAFETFPFPKNLNSQLVQHLEIIGEAYHEHRKQLMLGMQLGLTKTYNLFHSNAITAQEVNEKDKQVAALQKHLEKTPNAISFNEAIQGILQLRELHVQMDEAVLDAYGWNDIQLNHDFYEVDYLPENDRVRFTIHPDARKEVLKRLLDLNLKVYEEEILQCLHKYEDVLKFYEQKKQPVPMDVQLMYEKKKKSKPYKTPKTKTIEVNEDEGQYGLFK